MFRMLKVNSEKIPEDILKEEFLQERAAVLGRAGEKVSAVLEKLSDIEKVIEDRLSFFNRMTELCRAGFEDSNLIGLRRTALENVNAEIKRFNHEREYARMRYYYLIVTREAMGLYRHHWVEDMYRIPPRKKQLTEE